MASLEEAIKYGLAKLEYNEMRGPQRQVVEAYALGKDVFLSAPTGSGKSLCFEIAPYVLDCMKRGLHQVDEESTKTVCVVVAPLVSLMKDQVTALQQKRVAAICLGPECSSTDIEDVKTGRYNLIFASPEAIIHTHRSIFRSQLKHSIGAVFVDESHCIAKWGKDKGTEEAFRKDYGRLGELRSLVRKEVPFIALTATATNSVKENILYDLCMKDCVQITGNPNRRNTRYAVAEVDIANLYSSFNWLIDDLEQNAVDTPKVIIFCRRKLHMKELYELFSECLGDKAYFTPTGKEPKDDRSRLFAMYHKKTHKPVKETVEKEFCKPDGIVRVLFCSVAFGMGVNIKGAYLVLHIGPPSDLDDYLQETGRVGRELSQKSHAVLLKYKGCTSSKNISKEMREFVSNNSSCRRKLLLTYFGSDVPPDTVLHDCCDVCSRDCKCSCYCLDECTCISKCSQVQNMSVMEKHLRCMKESCETHQQQNVNNISRRGINKLQAYLLAYRLELASKVSQEGKSNLLTSLDITTGYSISLINQIIKNINYIRDEHYLKEHFAFFSDEHVQATWAYLCIVINSPDSDQDNNDNLSVTGHSGSESSNDSDDSNLSMCSSSKSYCHSIVLQSSNGESIDSS